MAKFTINVPFSGQFFEGEYSRTCGYLDAPVGGIFYGNLARVKREARKAADEYLKRCEATIRNREKRLIVCNDGTVLVVHYSDVWEYAIAQAGGKTACCLTGESFEVCRDRARDHAEQCYGGVAWESSL